MNYVNNDLKKRKRKTEEQKIKNELDESKRDEVIERAKDELESLSHKM